MARILIASLLALAIAYAASEDVKTEPNPHDLMDCNSKPGDVMLAEAEVVDEGHYLGTVGIDFTYPTKGTVQNKVINCIMVKDMVAGGSGGTITITAGGLNEKNVTIHLVSKFSKGIAYSIQIMGS